MYQPARVDKVVFNYYKIYRLKIKILIFKRKATTTSPENTFGICFQRILNSLWVLPNEAVWKAIPCLHDEQAAVADSHSMLCTPSPQHQIYSRTGDCTYKTVTYVGFRSTYVVGQVFLTKRSNPSVPFSILHFTFYTVLFEKIILRKRLVV